MGLHNLQPAPGSTRNRKRVGRGQGSGNGKTAGKGNKGQKARSGYKEKRNFEGGQQPLAKRLPKIGFSSRVVKPYVMNVEKIKVVATLDEITLESIKSVHKLNKSVKKVKLIGASAKELASKIKDENITTSGK
jgi:large subunit ribosomal protein L15